MRRPPSYPSLFPNLLSFKQRVSMLLRTLASVASKTKSAWEVLGDACLGERHHDATPWALSNQWVTPEGCARWRQHVTNATSRGTGRSMQAHVNVVGNRCFHEWMDTGVGSRPHIGWGPQSSHKSKTTHASWDRSWIGENWGRRKKRHVSEECLDRK